VATFTIQVPDKYVDAITWAKDRYNQSLGPSGPVPGILTPPADPTTLPGYCPDNRSFVMMILERNLRQILSQKNEETVRATIGPV
jgi:hypothetical protein